MNRFVLCALWGLATLPHLASVPAWAAPPVALQAWLELPQSWQRDTAGPIISLSEQGAFDDTHIFAPLVAHEGDRFQLWYCGSTGKVKERVFQLGLATSADGRNFTRHPRNPVYSFGDGKHSIMTPTLLRSGDGNALREEGRLRMWFSSTWFDGPTGRHTLHQASSVDGVQWSQPSAAQLENLYSPTILKTASGYRMWYIDVEKDPWIVRHAASRDGQRWEVTDKPCVTLTQSWERGRLFYPTVLQIDGVYLMWYGSYWNARRQTTALGFAVSEDGLAWYKHPQNPVVRPDPQRAWESHYTTSQSVIRLADGSFRIWFASRTKPPHVNKYFAINTARWQPKLPK